MKPYSITNQSKIPCYGSSGLWSDTSSSASGTDTSSRNKDLQSRHLSVVVGFIFLLGANFSSASGQTFFAYPIQSKNQNPFAMNHDLAYPGYSRTLRSNKAVYSARLDVINYLSQTKADGDYMFVDGETWILSNDIEYKVSSNGSLKLTLPWIHHNEGFLDRSIYHFHDITGLPQNGRVEDRSDLIRWDLRHDGDSVFSLYDTESGIGDLKATYSWQADLDTSKQWQIHVSFPSGSFAEQTGNEGMDVGLSYLAINPTWLSDRNWLTEQALSFWYGLGISFVHHPDEMKGFDPNPFVVNLRSGLGWRFYERWQARVQADTHSPLYRSGLRSLGWVPAIVSMSISHQLSNETDIEFTLIEDLRPRVTPDAVFSIGFNTAL